jgi:hypothetical protein
MSELSYRELQEQGVFDVPYRAFKYMQAQQTKIDELQARIDDLNELNRLKTIALQQSLNRTSIHVHEKIIALEKKLNGNKDEN